MFKTLCAVAWDAPLGLILIALFLAGLVVLAVMAFVRSPSKRMLREIGLTLCGASACLFACMLWFSATPRCRVARVARGQVSLDYVPAPFDCGPDGSAIRGVSRAVAQAALAQCDEDRWEAVAVPHDTPGHDALLVCRVHPGVEIWADHYEEWDAQSGWQVCFTACRAGACSPAAILGP